MRTPIVHSAICINTSGFCCETHSKKRPFTHAKVCANSYANLVSIWRYPCSFVCVCVCFCCVYCVSGVIDILRSGVVSSARVYMLDHLLGVIVVRAKFMLRVLYVNVSDVFAIRLFSVLLGEMLFIRRRCCVGYTCVHYVQCSIHVCTYIFCTRIVLVVLSGSVVATTHNGASAWRGVWEEKE